MSLRETYDEMFSNIYFTPDLTKCQRAEAFKLREERRYQTNSLYESNLKIGWGRIIKVPEKVVSSAAGAHNVAGPPVGST